MTAPVIRARDLRKVYRLYAKPQYRFLDMFGLLKSDGRQFTEHAALNGVSLDIRRGEKVAIIGRNGAGKSTFLKLVTRVIEPTSGELDVSGKVHALLQIGTGFHPDFTGRENVYAYLAQLGVSGEEADRRCAEIIEFAELEAYIDQPVKTYSTGMGVRLMFSTSTSIEPDLLVLDEVLGVGDAYFAHKSYERMKELCDASGTTLLLVTHDIYSAVKLCERVIWIDHGQVLMDGEASGVVTAYEDSVRQQEEHRLRRKKQERLKAIESEAPAAAPVQHVLLEIQARNNVPQPAPLYVSGLALLSGETVVAEVPVADAVETGPGSHVERANGCWGDVVEWQGRRARPLLNYGSPFHKGVVVFTLAPGTALAEPKVRIDYWTDEPGAFDLTAHAGGRDVPLGGLPPSAGAWARHVAAALPAADAAATPAASISITGRQGIGAILVTDVHTLDADGRESYQFRHGGPFTLAIRYRINQPGLRERAQVLVALLRDGVADTCRVMTRELLFDHERQPSGVITLRIPRFGLANGTYTVTVMVAQEGYYDREQTKYFSFNPEVYSYVARVLEFVVADGGIVGTGTAFVADGEWSLAAAAVEEDAERSTRHE